MIDRLFLMFLCKFARWNLYNKKILSKRNIDSFNYCYFCNEGNRRGVGFETSN